MKKCLIAMGLGLWAMGAFTQSISQRIEKAYKQFEADSQMKHAISSLYVIDANTGEVVFDKNSQVGLAGASTQKIVTAATAFELLGKDFSYKTEFWKYDLDATTPQTFMRVIPSGDPSLGSDRYIITKPASIISYLSAALDKLRIDKKRISWSYNNSSFDHLKIPGGWIWEDIGNYYGAGSGAFNWKENQSDIILSSGINVGSPVEIVKVDSLTGVGYIRNELKAGPPGSGDNAYYYFYYGNHQVSYPLLRGTIPVNQGNFSISIAVAAPFTYFVNELEKNKLAMQAGGYGIEEGVKVWNKNAAGNQLVYTHYSPTLDSLIYWFLKKSINLYGEALVKTFAYEKQGFGSTDSGVNIVKKFWKEKGLDEDELNIYDGSGLSPLNRLTTHAQVTVLKYARSRDWFKYYLDAFPEYNGMKMKSGTISDVKGFCGYQKSKEGREYIFSFLINNYSGRSSGIVSKMYKVLDELK